MKAFVAGATGYTGQEVVKALIAAGQEVVAHVRSDSTKLAEWTETFRSWGAEADSTPWVEAEIRKAISIHKPDLVFGLLGTTRARKKTSNDPENETYMSVDYGLTAMLLRAAEAQNPAPGFVYLSSYGVGPSSPSAYIQARHKLEEELRASTLDFLIIRPAVITGDRDESRLGEEIAGVVGDVMLKGLKAVGARKIHDKYASLDAQTLARGMVACALESELGRRDVDAAEIREKGQ